ncbi:MAG: hypothetical protein ABI255_01260 [Microbacteriaceae bacterium]
MDNRARQSRTAGAALPVPYFRCRTSGAVTARSRRQRRVDVRVRPCGFGRSGIHAKAVAAEAAIR